MCAADRAVALDREEAYTCGRTAVELAERGTSGVMVTMLRKANAPYKIDFTTVPLNEVAVKSKPDISTVPAVVEAIRQVEAELGDQGRVLVRYSGTQNACRVMVEGPTDALTETYCTQIADAVKAALG